MHMSHLSLPDDTTHRAAIAWEAVEPRIRALAAALAGPARRHPEMPVPADLLAPARAALKQMTPICASLGVPPLVPLHGTPTLIGLAARLAIAAAHLRLFREHFWLGHLDAETFIGWAVGQPFLPDVEPRVPRQPLTRLRQVAANRAAAQAAEAIDAVAAKPKRAPRRRQPAAPAEPAAEAQSMPDSAAAASA